MKRENILEKQMNLEGNGRENNRPKECAFSTK